MGPSVATELSAGGRPPDELPVLVLIFNNPSTTREVIRALGAIRPKRIYLAADGPRDKFASEVEVCLQAREAALSEILWDCEILERFLPENRGVKKGVKESIDWFFQHEDAGVILEHDCVPSQAFFRFASVLLDRYTDEENVFGISGTNMGYSPPNLQAEYFFSKYFFVWGWATWATRWSQVDEDIRNWVDWRDTSLMNDTSQGKALRHHWREVGDRVYNGTLDVLDFQLNLTAWQHNSYCIIPSQNLVKNIGFGRGATNTYSSNSWLARLGLDNPSLDLSCIPPLAVNEIADAWYERNVFHSESNAVEAIGRRVASLLDRRRHVRRWLSKNNLDWYVRKQKPPPH